MLDSSARTDAVNSLNLPADFGARPLRILFGIVFQFHFEE